MQQTGLWTRSLAEREADLHTEQRSKLRVALLGMRENVKHLVAQIHSEVEGLTVHDVSHLDALWEVADTVAGPQFALNPAEAFVFGASVLLHDAGMTIAAFAGGLGALRETVEWRDALAESIANNPSATCFEDLPDEAKKATNFAVLRLLHASQAEKLINIAFKKNENSPEIRLLEDTELRESFGLSIGKIAHSHHWDILRLQENLGTALGSASSLPPDWTVNEVKVACLLRCADAAHIDKRRAPSMLFAISRPVGHSAEHWTFQNNLNQVTRRDEKLIFTSGKSFSVEEAPAWWLCFDTLAMIDREVKNSNAVLGDLALELFSAKSVLGIESPSLLEKYIRVDGWTPVSAEVRVSDPVHLAKTLGGHNLYGDGPLAPIRELLQNAVDAVRARRVQEDREPEWGTVRLIVERDREEKVWLHVDDNGVGMSKRVMSGPLIDFGKSLWASSIVNEEFPGLRSKKVKPIGKFGIGFFSVFILGGNIKVISKKYTEGEAQTSVLEFSNLVRRPLMRPARASELPRDFSTRISVMLEADALSYFVHEIDLPARSDRSPPMGQIVKMICSADVEIELYDKINDNYISHKPDWMNVPPEDFLLELLGREELSSVIDAYAELMRPIRDNLGQTYGRAALDIFSRSHRGRKCLISVGGFTNSQPERHSIFPEYDYWDSFSRKDSNMVGVLVGDTTDISRKLAKSVAPIDAIASWASEQAGIIKQERFTKTQLLEFAHIIYNFGGNPGDLPFAFCEGVFCSFDVLKQKMVDLESIIIPLSFDKYDFGFRYLEIEKLTTNFFSVPTTAGLVVLHQGNVSLEFTDERNRQSIAETGTYDIGDEESNELIKDRHIRSLFDILEKIWGRKPALRITQKEIFSAQLIKGQGGRWCLEIHAGGERPGP